MKFILLINRDKAVINRYGFNSEGHSFALNELVKRLESYHGNSWMKKNDRLLSLPNYLPRSLRSGRILGINLGKNKNSKADSHQDYIDGVEKLGHFADYLVVNISSPNTPGLRSLQRKEAMEDLMNQVIYIIIKLGIRSRMLVIDYFIDRH